MDIDGAACQDQLSNIFTNFSKVDHLHLVPMNSEFDMEDVILQSFINQNTILNEQLSIRIDNLFGLKATLIESATGNKTSIQSLFARSEGKTNSFLNLTQYNSKRINFLIKRKTPNEQILSYKNLFMIILHTVSQLTPINTLPLFW